MADSPRVGLVVVSHSAPLAQAAVDLAMQMVHADPPPVVLAAGTADGGVGTDATMVMSAIEEANQGAGVVVLTDLGSAVMSAQLAVELMDEPADVRVIAAPFVEGLLAALVRADNGAGLDEVVSEATDALAPKLFALGEDDEPSPAVKQPAKTSAGVEATVWLVNPAGLHARPAAQIAELVGSFDATVELRNASGRTSSAASPIALALLNAKHGDELTLSASGTDAQRAVDALAELFAAGFGELGTGSDAPAGAASTLAAAGPLADIHRQVGVSPGRVVGPAYALRSQLTAPEITKVEPDDVEAELTKLRAALVEVVADYRSRAEATKDDAATEILTATAALAADENLSQAVTGLICDELLNAPSAIWRAVEMLSEQFHAAGGRLAERVTDLADIRDRVYAKLTGRVEQGIPELATPFILIADDLAPADTANLDPTKVLAIVTAAGGPTSHTSILARSLGIPAVVGWDGVDSVQDGTEILVDGDSGQVVVNPDETQRSSAASKPRGIEPLTGPGHLADGTHIKLMGNVGSVASAARLAEAGAEGIGLLRTEFCFLDRVDEPSVAEQTEIYAGMMRHFAGKEVTIRTLDAGSDKPISYLTRTGELNPALGVRGYRTVLDHLEVLTRQLEAIVAAVAQAGVHGRVMAPMITTVDEAAAFAELARAAGVQEVGVMIETPAAALGAEQILQVVDFVSLGTNDLAQYTMAADRLDADLAALQSPWQPAVLQLIGMVGEAGGKFGKAVGVCGEAASDPQLAPVLVGLGVTSLSMGPGALSEVAEALRSLTMEQCRAAARRALSG